MAEMAALHSVRPGNAAWPILQAVLSVLAAALLVSAGADARGAAGCGSGLHRGRHAKLLLGSGLSPSSTAAVRL